MTSSSDRFSDRARGTPPPAAAGGSGAAARPAYARFIPREELAGFAAWQPGSFGNDNSHKPRAAPPAPDPEALRRAAEAQAQAEQRRAFEAAERAEAERHQALRAARDGGYQDGYRDGLSALETFKQSFAAQTSAQVGALVGQMNDMLDTLEQDLAQRVAGIALEIARQVVRAELSAQPDVVVAVTQEALGALLMSARHVTVRVHPDDHALIAAGCAELMAARGARLVGDASLERGGCLVESDIGAVDARVAQRWQRATAAFTAEVPWERRREERAPMAPAMPATTVTPAQSAPPEDAAGSEEQDA